MRRNAICVFLVAALLLQGCHAFDVSVSGQPVTGEQTRENASFGDVMLVVLGLVFFGAVIYAGGQAPSGP